MSGDSDGAATQKGIAWIIGTYTLFCLTFPLPPWEDLEKFENIVPRWFVAAFIIIFFMRRMGQRQRREAVIAAVLCSYMLVIIGPICVAILQFFARRLVEQ